MKGRLFSFFLCLHSLFALFIFVFSSLPSCVFYFLCYFHLLLFLLLPLTFAFPPRPLSFLLCSLPPFLPSFIVSFIFPLEVYLVHLCHSKCTIVGISVVHSPILTPCEVNGLGLHGKPLKAAASAGTHLFPHFFHSAVEERKAQRSSW